MFQPGSRFWSLNVWGVWLVQYSCLVGAIPQLWILRPFREPVIQFGRYFDVDLLLQNFEMYAGQSARVCVSIMGDSSSKPMCMPFNIPHEKHDLMPEEMKSVPLNIQIPKNFLQGKHNITASVTFESGAKVENSTQFNVKGIVSTKSYLSHAFVINLDKNPGRWQYTRERLREAGYTSIKRFAAIDGSSTALNFEAIGIHHGMPGHKGCTASHRSLWMRVRELMLTIPDIHIVSIYEDDVIFNEHFSSIIGNYVEALPNDLDIVYMGWMRGGVNKQVSDEGDPHFTRMVQFVDKPTSLEENLIVERHPACLHAYALTLKGVTRLLQYSAHIKDAVDMHVAWLIQQKIVKGYAFNGKHAPASARTRRNYSDLGIVYQDPVLGTNIDGYDKVLLLNQIVRLQEENHLLKTRLAIYEKTSEL